MIADEKGFKSRIKGGIGREPYYKKLEALETKLIKLSPLPMSYDINRGENPYFPVYTYTELAKNAIYVQPLSTEIACRMSCVESDSLDISVIEHGDKYSNRMNTNKAYDEAILLCGSNLLPTILSEERLASLAFYNKNVVVKPHPMTNERDMSMLRSLFGDNRVLGVDVSGHQVMMNSKKLYTLKTSTLAWLALHLGKDVEFLDDFFGEAIGVVYPLIKYNAPISHMAGIFVLGVNDTEENIQEYFSKTMELRELLRPLAQRVMKQPPK